MARNEILWLIQRLKGLVDWEEKLSAELEELSRGLPCIENILEIKGLGMRTVTGILAMWQKLAALKKILDKKGSPVS